METATQERTLLERLRDDLVNRGWEVEEHSFITHRGRSVEVDLLGRKGRTSFAVECKAGIATASDVGVLRDVPATRRFLIANDWASQELARVASNNSVVLVRPNEIEKITEAADTLNMMKPPTGMQMRAAP